MKVKAVVIRRVLVWLNDPEHAQVPSDEEFEICEVLGLVERNGDGDYEPKFIPVDWESR